jgi:histidinol-phosphate aminotransferase
MPADVDVAALGHHGDVEVAEGMVDFAVNVHATGPPQWLAEALREAVDDVGRYPDPAAARRALAALHQVPPECVLLVSGAAEAFTLLAALPWRRPVVVHPQFTEPEAALRAHGHEVDRLVLDAEDGFRLGTRGAEVPEEADLVVMGNPTNPTSRLHPPEEVQALVAPGRLVVVDEAFMDAVEAPGQPSASLCVAAAEGSGLAVVRSLTKTYAVPGVRVGYVVADPATVLRLQSRQPHWAASTLACVAAEACCRQVGQRHADQVRAGLPARLDHLATGLAAAGLRVVEDPRAPFVLAQDPRGPGLRDRLRERGFAVRRGDTFPGLGPDWVRIAAREQHDQDGLLAAISQAGHRPGSRRECP